MPLVLRNTKGSPLTFAEGDGNFLYLLSGSFYRPYTGSVSIRGEIKLNNYGANSGSVCVLLDDGDNVFSTNSGAGSYASSVRSVILGSLVGQAASDINQSVLIGPYAAQNAGTTWNSVFLGYLAGATSISSNSTFIGYQAGTGTNSPYSIYIGYNAGNSNIVSTPSDYNIILGTNITLAANVSRSLNIGGVIFASGLYNNTGGNPVSGSVNGFVGINKPNPAFPLDVSGSVAITGSINVSSLMRLQPQNPLPAGSLGAMAVSSSGKLFYFSGSWNQIF